VTTWYSTAFTSDGINRSSLDDAKHLAPAAVDGGRVAYKRAYVDISGIGTLINSTEVRFFTIKSGDRPISLYLTCDGSFAADWTLDIGLWDSGENHNGIELRRNMFKDNEALHVAVNRTEILARALFSVTDENRGLAAWEMVDILGTVGGVTYGSNPKEDWELVGFLVNLETPGVGGKLLVEMYYLPEGG